MEVVRTPDDASEHEKHEKYQRKIQSCPRSLLVADTKYGQERFLGYLDIAHLFHAFFPCLLLFQQFLLPCYVATIALRKNVLAQGLDGFARSLKPSR